MGDFVLCEVLDAEFAYIHRVLPRKSMLTRKEAGKKVRLQVVGANIDRAFIVEALTGDFSLNRLARYLAVVTATPITPVLLLTKSDLVAPEVVEAAVNAVHEHHPNLLVVPLGFTDPEGYRRVLDIMEPRSTNCLIGSSGVGKSTLINTIAPDLNTATAAVRLKDSKGRHTTTRRSLYVLEGALVLDTPGMRELGVLEAVDGISATFHDLEVLAKECRFHDCSHLQEEGCALLGGIAEGTVSKSQYDNYMKLRRENARNNMDLAQRRKKDKAFGKMFRSVMYEKKRLSDK